MSVAAIVIGRNEGDRLKACLASLQGSVKPLVYVDSGSTDGSVEAAREFGADVVELDMAVPFTAARARNTGLARAIEIAPATRLIQFLDGDCTLHPDWIGTAQAALAADSDLAVVCGRRREKYPEASLWNRLIDAEWDTPIGEARACGGDALIRRQALEDVGGYPDGMIAGEEPEMCFRMRQKGWKIRRIDAEMTSHDAAMTRFSQWWKRARRAGHAYAEGAALHGRETDERYNMAETRRALLWGAGLPVALLFAAFLVTSWALSGVLIYPAQVVRLKAKGLDWVEAVFLTLAKFPEALGVLSYWQSRLTGRQRRLIEYK